MNLHTKYEFLRHGPFAHHCAMTHAWDFVIITFTSNCREDTDLLADITDTHVIESCCLVIDGGEVVRGKFHSLPQISNALYDMLYDDISHDYEDIIHQLAISRNYNLRGMSYITESKPVYRGSIYSPTLQKVFVEHPSIRLT